MSRNVISIRANNSNGTRTLYTCPVEKLAKIVFINRAVEMPRHGYIVGTGVTANVVSYGGYMSLANETLLYSSDISGTYSRMAVNPFIYENNAESCGRAVGNRIVAFDQGGTGMHSRYLNDSELILSEGESVSVSGNANVSIKIFEEDL